MVASLAAVCSVIALIVFGLKGDSEIIEFLKKPGVVDEAKDRTQDVVDKKKDESPLVKQSKALALRIDPPKPKVVRKKPRPKVVKKKPKPKVVKPPRPKSRVNARFTLLATLQCDDPTRSMVLLKQTGGKEEWFWQGERVGHLDINEVRNGSVVVSQGGRKQQVLFVPDKPKIQTLLKDESSKMAAKRNGPKSTNVTLGLEMADKTTSVIASM